jgi:acetolactate synthase-1/2/3 large subunit
VAAKTGAGQIATLIGPADTAWGDGGEIAKVAAPPGRASVEEGRITAAAKALKSGEATMLFLGDRALREDGLALAARIVAKTGAKMLAQTSNARMQRGAGRIAIDRLPYPVDMALALLKDIKHLIIVGTTAPIAFFAYPDKPSRLTPDGCDIQFLAHPAEDQIDALTRLADAVGATKESIKTNSTARPSLPKGPLDPAAIAATIGALLPEGAIVTDESVTTGRGFFPATHGAPPHDWLQLSGGAIGLGIPLAVGAAVACPDRKVIALQADGSGMYTVQGLWTQAREKLNVLTLIWSNHSYAILRHELAGVGAQNPGPKALDMLSLGNPDLDWVNLAKGLGVEARRATTAEELASAFSAGLAHKGPFLIEVML